MGSDASLFFRSRLCTVVRSFPAGIPPRHARVASNVMPMDPALSSLKEIKARDILVSDVIVASEDDKIRELETLMFKKSIGGLPIVREGNKGRKTLVGMLTHRDIMLARRTVSLGGMLARDLMSHDVITVQEDATLLEILSKMRDNNVERIPVVNNGGTDLVGMIMHKNVLLKVLEILER